MKSFRSNSLPFYAYQSEENEEMEGVSSERKSNSKMIRCQSMPTYIQPYGIPIGGSGGRRRGSEGDSRQTSRMKRHFAPLPTSLMAAYRKKHGDLGWHEQGEGESGDTVEAFR